MLVIFYIRLNLAQRVDVFGIGKQWFDLIGQFENSVALGLGFADGLCFSGQKEGFLLNPGLGKVGVYLAEHRNDI